MFILLCATVMGLGLLIHLEDHNCLVLFTLVCPSSPNLEGEQTIFRMRLNLCQQLGMV